MERFHVSWIGRLNNLRYFFLILSYNSMQSKSKSRKIFTKKEMFFLTSVWKSKIPRIAKTILKKKNKTEGLTLPDFQTYYRATIIKILWYIRTIQGLIEQDKGFRIRPSCIWSIDFYKVAKASPWRKLNFFQQIVLEKLDQYMEKTLTKNIYPYFIPSPKLIQAESQTKL